MKDTKIEWCDATLNPVIGCTHGCSYCYARKMNDRFGWVNDFAQPQFLQERLKELKSKTSKVIFMDSMSDISCWSIDVIEKVTKAMNENLQHIYLFLTKGNANAVWNALNSFVSHSTYQVGRTVTTYPDPYFEKHPGAGIDFLSIEPILTPMGRLLSEVAFPFLKAVIIGAETGNRKGKVIPKKAWIDDLVKQADNRGLRVFMKGSLKEIMGDDFRQDELHWNQWRDRNNSILEVSKKLDKKIR